jgi:hypothetical protein
MLAGKLMKRIVNPDGVDVDDIKDPKQKDVIMARQIHDMTYGISSDAMMHFAVVFSALIHDVDHTGFANKERTNMQAPVAAAYYDKCVAEQNAVDISWKLLMSDNYKDLGACIYSTRAEMKRFRELVVDEVMASDIADKELQSLQKSRWADAFDASLTNSNIYDERDVDRKATIVYEHIIQASD